jgi:hypothetical protein
LSLRETIAEDSKVKSRIGRSNRKRPQMLAALGEGAAIASKKLWA